MGRDYQGGPGAPRAVSSFGSASKPRIENMALSTPFPYTSVINGSTFGLLLLRTISSIVNISASTLVPLICRMRIAMMGKGISAGPWDWNHLAQGCVCLIDRVAVTAPFETPKAAHYPKTKGNQGT